MLLLNMKIKVEICRDMLGVKGILLEQIKTGRRASSLTWMVWVFSMFLSALMQPADDLCVQKMNVWTLVWIL